LFASIQRLLILRSSIFSRLPTGTCELTEVYPTDSGRLDERTFQRLDSTVK
jgi:hypothetical protein